MWPLYGVELIVEVNIRRVSIRLGNNVRSLNSAFTLIELLTVVAIIAILFTLLTTALSSAKKASHQARCISNLRQIALMVDMYLDDYGKRTPGLENLISGRYLTKPSILLCPSDKTSGWGNYVNLQPLFNINFTTYSNGAQIPMIPYSYLNPFPWEDWAWDMLISQGGRAGIAVCQLHGLGRPNLEMPSYRDFQGLILRAQRDGAVVKRQVFWDGLAINTAFNNRNPSEGFAPPPSSPVTDNSEKANSSLTEALNANGAIQNGYPWRLFSDDSLGQ